nr:MAG TPA: hypothetical protein [Bacteriophage sp.]
MIPAIHTFCKSIFNGTIFSYYFYCTYGINTIAYVNTSPT